MKTAQRTVEGNPKNAGTGVLCTRRETHVPLEQGALTFQKEIDNRKRPGSTRPKRCEKMKFRKTNTKTRIETKFRQEIHF